MERLKVPDLKAEAKRLGLRRFSRLRKSQLIDLINQPHANDPPLLDEPVPEINSQILQPTAVKKNPKKVIEEVRRRREESERRTEKINRRREIRELEEMLGLGSSLRSRPPPKIKISTPEETERDRKISEIKEINRRSRTRQTITERASALRGFARQFRIEREGNHGAREFMQIVRTDVLRIMRENRQTRVRVILNCVMSRKELFSENFEYLETYFHSETIENLGGIDESAVFNSFIETIEERIQNFNQRGSNWRLESVLSLDIQMTDFIPLKGTSWIPLPGNLVGKRAIINMKNEDEECFKWCVTRALFPVEKNAERIDQNLKENSKRINWRGLKFSIELSDITQFENLNENISVNVFGFEKVIYPLRLFKGQKRDHEINLLLIADEVEEIKHFCLMKNMSRLVSKQISKHNGSKEICFRCFNTFPSKDKFNIP